jgi:aspartyl/asparaginyl-tRNA synthetase
VIALVETLLGDLCRSFLNEPNQALVRNRSEVEAMAANLTSLKRISVDEAAHRLGYDPKNVVCRADGQYISSKGEQALLNQIGMPFWLVHHHAALTPFYQKACIHSPNLSETADLIMGIGETVGAGARHATGAEVRMSLAAQNVVVDNYRWYVEMKENRPLQTAGFGMGVERFLMWVTGETDIRHFEICPRRLGQVCVP